jgi:hypothetical protein
MTTGGSTTRTGQPTRQRSGDVLQALLADVFEFGVDLAAHLAERVFRDADAAGLGNALEPAIEGFSSVI